MTITLYLYHKTLIRDLQTLTHIFQYNIEMVDKLRKHYEPLNIFALKSTKEDTVAIQVTPEEFALIGVFNGGI